MKNVRKNLGTRTFFSDGAFVTRIVFEKMNRSCSLHICRIVQAKNYLRVPRKSVKTASIYSEALKAKNVKG